MSRLALHGGSPVRDTPLPYGRQWIRDEDVAAVAQALRADLLTTGPRVQELERRFAQEVGASHAVAFSSGTAALHGATHALGLGPGDEVIVPPLTFVASANAVLYQGATPVFADVDEGTLLLDPSEVERLCTPRTRAVVAVDYAGQPCDYRALRSVTGPRGISILGDACHALGASSEGRPVGALADFSAFSLHPVKHVTAGEGGITTTEDLAAAERMRRFRHHGIRRSEGMQPWEYEVDALGNNYRLTDFQCALGLSQLGGLPGWLGRRREIAAGYDRALEGFPELRPLAVRAGVEHAYHLYVVALDEERLSVGRDEFLGALRAEGILATVHYPCVHLQPYYRQRFGVGPGLCPRAERAARRVLSLPIFPLMSPRDEADVISAVGKVVEAFRR